MTSSAYTVFQRLIGQVDDIRDAAAREAAAGFAQSAPVLLRSGLVLTVAAFDTYVHEQGVKLLKQRARVGATEAQAVVQYLGRLSLSDLTGPNAEGYIRYRLSYRTLVAPDKVSELFAAAGLNADDLWLGAAIALGSRPDRLKLHTQLQYERRNQIAHEGDWDFVALAFRPLEDAHLDDCVRCLCGLVHAWDQLLP
jgi:hypothetical protein